MPDWKRKPAGERLEERRSPEGVIYLAFPALERLRLVKHAFSTRIGGVSRGCCSSMNLSFTKEPENRENVLENYARMARAIGVSPDSFVLTYQTHTTNILRVGEAQKGSGIEREREYRDIDGLITNERGITLVTFFADCIPLYFADPVKKAIGLSHSGWRGTVNKMAKVSIKRMEEEFGSSPSDIVACVGPGICRDCYEVGEEVAEAFRAGFSREDTEKILIRKPDQKYLLDLWEANRILLLQSGVSDKNIHIGDICTHCNPELLFSHRGMGEERGNLGAFLALA
ncbi:MAG: peptidoglycan editing factor PgeF [Johnsonella sp.]|nr:peptidoglycan editing factor PgeF [Johnsonella sp.]